MHALGIITPGGSVFEHDPPQNRTSRPKARLSNRANSLSSFFSTIVASAPLSHQRPKLPNEPNSPDSLENRAVPLPALAIHRVWQETVFGRNRRPLGPNYRTKPISPTTLPPTQQWGYHIGTGS